MFLVAAVAACDLAGPPSGWFERVCEATRILAEEIAIEDPEDTSQRNAAAADQAMALLVGAPPWSEGAAVTTHLAAAAEGIRAASDGWSRADFDARIDGLSAYLDGIQAAEPMIEALAAQHGRGCSIDSRYPKLEVPI